MKMWTIEHWDAKFGKWFHHEECASFKAAKNILKGCEINYRIKNPNQKIMMELPIRYDD